MDGPGILIPHPFPIGIDESTRFQGPLVVS